MQEEEVVITGEVGGTFTPAPSGNHLAILTRITMLGTIDNSFEGHVKRDPMLRLEFELVNTNHVFDEDKGPEPFVIAKNYKLSMNEKANLRKMIEGWIGEKLQKDEAKNFNVAKMLRAQCMCNVVHRVSQKNGNTYAEIASIAQVPDGVEVKEPRTDVKIFILQKGTTKETFDSTKFAALPEFIQKIIKTSDEYIALFGAETAQQTTGASPAPTTSSAKKRPF